ncbi:hypothetical protein [Tatumella ptyseos]|uniref:hypothetical protein n=1 Tax=Tatumella ptyseos TaxID=82987 RepID=UPI0014372A75|nr:hypothetical protein [Tatumella ptyseos]QHJ84203.1 MAG: hypothetical protein [Bacteriophage sp.]
MKIIDFCPEHLAQITLQEKQREAVLDENYAAAISSGRCFTGLDNGKVVVIGGLVPVTENRVYLHMIVSDGIPHLWPSIYRAARKLIDELPETVWRIEALSTFPEADRWHEMLGFECEGLLRRVMPDGRDAKSYSIVR